MFGRFCREKRGASIITYALTLPLFVLLVFGILEIWRVMAVRQSLNLGAYQAMRYLSSQGRDWLPSSAGAWETIAASTATYTINAELQRNALVPDDSTLQVQVAIEPNAPANLDDLGWFFTVRAELALPDVITVQPLSAILPSLPLKLVEEQWSYIEGRTGDWIPPQEGPPY